MEDYSGHLVHKVESANVRFNLGFIFLNLAYMQFH